MNDLDKWAAEQCGVETWDNKEWEAGWKFKRETGFSMHDNHYKWTLSDPRCREVFREKFKLSILFVIDEWLCMWHRSESKPITGKGKTIAEAEIACAKAIYEAHDNLRGRNE